MNKLILLLTLFLASLPAGAQGNPSGKPTILPMMKDGGIAAYVRFQRPKITQGLILNNPEANSVDSKVVKGFEGAFPSSSSSDNMLYFQTATDLIVTQTGTFYVTIQYFDEGQGAIDLEHITAGQDGSLAIRSTRFFMGNSGSWQQHTFTLENALLNHSLPGGNDFRIRCPGVPLRQIAISRIPFSDPQQVISPVFKQPLVTPPSGMDVAIHPSEGERSRLWTEPQFLQEKSQLYHAWGTSQVIDTVAIQDKDGRPDLSPFQKRVRALSDLGLTWVPRFKIGQVGHLPASLTHSLQVAMGTERTQPGPMVSLWEPRLPDLYGQLFMDMGVSRLNTMPLLILSFAGDWGPLLLHDEPGSETAWPDIWAGDPLALRSFRSTLQTRYGLVKNLNSAWGTQYGSWNEIIPQPTSVQYRPARGVDTLQWYQSSLTEVAQAITAKARQAFPRAKIVLEITDGYSYAATDLLTFAELAQQQRAAVVLYTKEAQPTYNPSWLLLAQACRMRNVPFGLRINGGKDELLGAFYALASEEGSLLWVDQDTLAQDNAWAMYRETMQSLRLSAPQKKVALVYPRTTILAQGDTEFDRVVMDLRERFAFDIFDERDLGRLNSITYPLLLSPWGSYWSEDALNQLQSFAHNGGALVARAGEPWQTIQGKMDINERLFAVQLQEAGGSIRMVSRRESTQPFEQASSGPLPERRVLDLGNSQADPFLQGQWSPPQSAASANALGLQIANYRWIGERASLTVPMNPRRRYEVEIQGFLPKGKMFTVMANRKKVDTIQGTGVFTWRKPIPVNLNANKPELELTLHGNTWRTGEVLNATQTARVGMAVSRIAIFPQGEASPGVSQDRVGEDPQFDRSSLYRSWLREVGRGFTIMAPADFVNAWVYEEMASTIAEQPGIIDPRYRFALPPDGERNQTVVTPLSGMALYLNHGHQPVTVRAKSKGARGMEIPGQVLYYVPLR